jgi:ABC-type Fe3+-hydroxamate transport system substrate-binding protein
VDASYSCTAAIGSSLSSCAGTVTNGDPIDTTSVVGSNSFSVTATDADGQTTTVTHTYNVVALPPSVTLTTPPSVTATYTYGQVVDASYSCTAGAGSSISTCVGTVANGSAITTSSVGSGKSFSVTATDADGQTTMVTHTYNVVALPPSVTLTTPPSVTATYTYGQVVDASYSCTGGGGSSISTCVGTVANGSAITTSSVGSGKSFSVTATDADGQTTMVTHTYNVVALPPSVTLTTPPSGTPTYTYGQVVDASYSCTPGGGSTLSTCVGTLPSGSAITTTTLGSNSFKVTATDADGQSTTVTHYYNVVAASTSLEAWPQLIEFEPFVGIGSGVVAATLTSGGHPVSGQTIYFTVGSTALCHATTNAAGFAICAISPFNQALLYRTNYYSASYTTTSDYTGSTATTPVVTFF